MLGLQTKLRRGARGVVVAWAITAGACAGDAGGDHVVTDGGDVGAGYAAPAAASATMPGVAWEAPAVAAPEVTPRGELGTLTVAPLDAGGPWRGTFELATTGDVVAWQATWDDGKKVARARYEHERTGQIVDVTVDAARAFGVEARVGGVVVDGIGAPTPVEAGALEALAADGLGLAIAGVNLELACVVDGEAHGRPLRAAMMYPWQLLVKYDAAFPGMHTLADHTRCRWTEDALDDQAIAAAYEPAALPDDGEALRALFEGAWRRADVDGSVVVARWEPVPWVRGYWPFDDEGAVARPERAGLCTERCAGTCGDGCNEVACARSWTWVCELDHRERTTGFEVAWRREACGSSAPCRTQDACYADCQVAHGCGTWEAATCRRGCDGALVASAAGGAAVAALMCEEGACAGLGWMLGDGPYDATDVRWTPLEVTRRVARAESCACDDGDPCTDDVRGADGKCRYSRVSCDDGDACTKDHCGPGGVCVAEAVSCDDGDPCTVDSCDPVTGCASTPISCDDGDACTVDSCDPVDGTCVYAAQGCDDGDACTVDSCDPALGCVTDAVDCTDRASCDEACCGSCPTCGDGVCDADESCGSCAADCGKCAYCGDGVCGADEGCDVCAADCGWCTECGDGTCDATESCLSCADDCGSCLP